MSDTRAERLKRLHEVQQKKRQLDEHRLGEARREGEALAATSEEILRSLGEDSILHGYFLEAKAKALRRNEVRIAENRKVQIAAAERLQESLGFEKRLERAAADAGREAARQREASDLLLALDEYMTASAASLETGQGATKR